MNQTILPKVVKVKASTHMLNGLLLLIVLLTPIIKNVNA